MGPLVGTDRVAAPRIPRVVARTHLRVEEQVAAALAIEESVDHLLLLLHRAVEQAGRDAEALRRRARRDSVGRGGALHSVAVLAGSSAARQGGR